MRRAWVAVLALTTAACSSRPADDPSASTSASTSTTMSSPRVPTGPEVSWDGLLVVDSASGDLLQFLDGRWVTLQDGPSYSDESASTFVESALSFDDRVLAAWCCEPVVGFVAFASPDFPVPLAYGTRPVRAGSQILAFQDLFDDSGSPSVSILATDMSSAYASLEYALDGVVGHGRRIVGAQDGGFLFTWTPDANMDSGVWYVGRIESTDAGFSVDLSTTHPLPTAMDFAATEDGSLYLFEVGTESPGWFGFTPNLPPVRLGELPASTHDLAIREGAVLALSDTGLLLGPSFEVWEHSLPSAAWVGW